MEAFIKKIHESKMPLKVPIRSIPAVSKLIPKLKYKVKHEPVKLRNPVPWGQGPRGPEGRLIKIRGLVTELFKQERIELNNVVAEEIRDYAERLIAEAIKNGDKHEDTMELADFWLQEKQLVHKLFKVFVPRYQNYQTSYTEVYNAPSIFNRNQEFKRMIIELKGNPFPPVVPEQTARHNWLHNILLAEAREEFYNRQKISKKVTESLQTYSDSMEDNNTPISDATKSPLESASEIGTSETLSNAEEHKGKNGQKINNKIE